MTIFCSVGLMATANGHSIWTVKFYTQVINIATSCIWLTVHDILHI